MTLPHRLPPVAHGMVLLLALPLLDTAPAVPSWDQLVNLGPSGLLAVGFWLLASGRLVPASVSDKAEARAEAATAAAEKATTTAKEAVDAVARLTQEHTDERKAFESELDGLQRELVRLSGGMGGMSGGGAGAGMQPFRSRP